MPIIPTQSVSLFVRFRRMLIATGLTDLESVQKSGLCLHTMPEPECPACGPASARAVKTFAIWERRVRRSGKMQARR